MCFYGDANPNRFEFRKKHRVAKWVRRADKREMHRAKNRHRLKKAQLAKKVAKRTDNVV